MRTKDQLIKMAVETLGGKEEKYSKMSGEAIKDAIAEHNSTADTLPQIKVNLGRDFKDLAKDQQSIMLNSLNWVAEEKLDGVRVKLHMTKDGIRVDGRRRSDQTCLFTERTANFPQLAKAGNLEALAGTVLDGELIMQVEGVDTGSVVTEGFLTASIAVTNSSPEKSIGIQEKFGSPEIYIFDLVRFKGKKMDRVSFAKRRQALEKIFIVYGSGLSAAKIWIMPQERRRGKIEGLYRAVVKGGGEGVMLKDIRTPYEEGKRSKGLVKWKKVITVDAIITGYLRTDEEKGWANLVGAFEVSCYDENGELHVIGACQPGTLEFRKQVSTEDGSLKEEWYGKAVEVRGNEWTKNRKLRHCVLLRFREDKNPEECKLDFKKIKVGGAA